MRLWSRLQLPYVPRLVAALWLALMVLAQPALAQSVNSGSSVALKGPIFSAPSLRSVAATPAAAGSVTASTTPAAPGTSASTFKVDQNFDHRNTHFPLEGAHIPVTCETCHKGGIFKGTPVACASCHNDGMAKGKTLNHPKSSDLCAECHNQTDFKQIHVDHTNIHNGCFTCHDGKVATGKNSTHIKSTNACEECHVTTTWVVFHFDHNTTHEPCQVCHDSVHTDGKPVNHPRSVSNCAQCHTTVNWKIGVFDHTGVTNGCFKCHNGIDATGMSADHLRTSTNCENCHTTLAWTPVHFDHSDPSVTGQACEGCHDGRRATGRSSTHYPVLNASANNPGAPGQCNDCHTTTAWKPATWDHSLALDVTNCFACHTGKHHTSTGHALGKLDFANHVPGSNTCVNCHANTFTNWANGKMDVAAHIAEGITVNCKSCHFVGNKFGAKAKSTAHLPTTDTCESCHTVAVSFVPAMTPFNHAQAANVTNCVACHDGAHTLSGGAKVLGKNDGAIAPHMPASNNCNQCHNTTSFAPAKNFDHADAGVAGTPCATCHNATSPLVISTGPLLSKASAVPAHVTSSDNCQDCHTTTTWANAKFNHTGITNNCVSCHDGVQAKGPNGGSISPHMNVGAGLMAGNPDCVQCHTNFSAFVGVSFGEVQHGLVSAIPCVTCHNGTTAISTGKLQSKASATNHLPSADTCQDCHKDPTFTSWKTVTFDHSGIGAARCDSCHNGTTAKGVAQAAVKHVPFPAAADCKDCHGSTNFTAFNPVPFAAPGHAVVASLTCISCHNGTQAISTGKLISKASYPNHIASASTCQDCHNKDNSFSTWKTVFDHANIGSATCVSCHNGTTAKGVANAVVKHIPFPGTLDCNACHTNFTSFSPVSFGVAEHGKVSPSCYTCHNGTQAITKGPLTTRSAAHILVTGTTCETCHTTTATWNVAANKVAHNLVSVTCLNCHNGTSTLSLTKAVISNKGGALHLPTTDTCATCHTTGGVPWTPAKLPFDHTQTSSTCVTCHDGTHVMAASVNSTGGNTVLGKPATGHVPSSNDCNVCHTSTTSFKTWKFTHSDAVVAVTACKTCHDGQFAGVVARAAAASDVNAPVHTSASFDSCGDCHTTVAFIPANFKHANVTGLACASCHNTGMPNAVVRPVTHIAISGGAAGTDSSGNDCGACHNTVTWVTNAKPDHSGFVHNCISCHGPSGSAAVKINVATHLSVLPSAQCDFCHTTVAFKPAIRFDHTLTSVTTCFTCHNGSTAISTGKLTTKSAAHIVIVGTACEDCHKSTTVWNVSSSQVDHTQVSATCTACHSGSTKLSLTGGTVSFKGTTHLGTTNTCTACHTTGGVPWTPSKAFDHTQANGGGTTGCYACHNGTLSVSDGKLYGKSINHILSTTTCETCHKSYLNWNMTAAQVDHTAVTGTCVSCHDGAHKTSLTSTPIDGKPGTHVATTTNCAACHFAGPKLWTPTIQVHQTDHTQTLGDCFTCHSGSVAIKGGNSQGTLVIMGKLNGPNHTHMSTANTCADCHSTTAFIPALAFNHSSVAAGTCYTCHNNVQAQGKLATHLPTNNTCDDCHTRPATTTGVWKPIPVAQYKHTSNTVQTCYTCHNGTTAISTGKLTTKSAAHIAVTTTACESCHKTTASWNVSAAQVDHTLVSGTCFTCHNGTSKLSLTGTLISNKGPTHLPVNNTCDACHAVGPTPWTPAKTFDHNQKIGACVGCHDNAHAVSDGYLYGKKAQHLTTTNLCENCHVVAAHGPTDWKVTPLTAFDHSQAIGTCMSCHDGTHKMDVSNITLDSKANDTLHNPHMTVTLDCSSCHTTVNWIFTSYTHSSPNYVSHTPGKVPAGYTGCPLCHTPYAQTITYKQPSLVGFCASCHSTDFAPGSHKKYGSVNYTFTELKDCTGACHTYTDQTLTKIQTTRNTNPKHRPSSSSWN